VTSSPSDGADYPLVLKVWHWKKRGEPELMGLCETTLTELQARAQALQDADPRVAPAVAGADTQPLPVSALSDGTPLARAHAFQLVDPAAASTTSASSKRAGATHAGLVYVTSATVTIKDSSKRKSQRSQRRKTLTEASIMMSSAEPSRTKMVWPW
jgi:hypothetical protein